MAKPTLKYLREWFECNTATAHELQDIWEVGYDHGHRGYYPDGDYSSDADWCYGTGAAIGGLETRLGIDDGSVFDLYTQGHGEGLNDGGHLNDDDEQAS